MPINFQVCPCRQAVWQQVLTIQDPRTFHEVVGTGQNSRRYVL
jgi:hypothetical protein